MMPKDRPSSKMDDGGVTPKVHEKVIYKLEKKVCQNLFMKSVARVSVSRVTRPLMLCHLRYDRCLRISSKFAYDYCSCLKKLIYRWPVGPYIFGIHILRLSHPLNTNIECLLNKYELRL